MAYEELPTHLGGAWANLAWEDLTGPELIQASVGSPLKASQLICLAEAQRNAALEQGNRADTSAYEHSQQILAQIALPVLRHDTA